MKTWLFAVMVATLGLHAALGAETLKLNYCVQLIRGNNSDQPPVANAKPIGAKLTQKLRPIFNWQNYWEMNRKQLELATGQKVRVRLSKEREVEIDLTRSGKRVVTAYEQEKRVSRMVSPIGEGMTITGGDRDEKSMWFIVVRRDSPAN